MTGELIEVEVTGVAHGGISVARLDGRVVFVSDAIPGERVIAEVTDDAKASFWRADTVEVLTPSPHRREHVWEAASIAREPANRAGGAEFGHIALAHQRELKRQVIVDALARMAKVDAVVEVEPIPSGAIIESTTDATGVGWRTRLRLHVAENGTLGPFAARSHRVIPVTGLPLAVPEAEAVIDLAERFTGAEFVDVIVPSTGNPYVLAHDGARAPRSSRIVERVGDREFRLDARGFWQVHRHAAQTLTAAVQEAIDPAMFHEDAANLDLYGGVGLLAAAMGDRFGKTVRMTTVESDAAATEHAGENLVDWVGAHAVTARVDRYLQRLAKESGTKESERIRRGTVVLDPPRSGAGKAVVAALAELRPAQLVYVACDPVALARDIGLFGAGGYRLSGIRAFDLFPNTHHVEAVATLVRADEAQR